MPKLKANIKLELPRKELEDTATLSHRDWEFVSCPSNDLEENFHSFFNKVINSLKAGTSLVFYQEALHSKELIAKRKEHLPKPDRVSLGFFTSGSTGAPKVILHHFSHLLQSQRESEELLTKDPTFSGPHTRRFSSLPWFHVGGFLCFLRKALEKNFVFVSSKDLTRRTLKEEKPTVVIGVPTQLHDLVMKKENDEGNSILFYSGGGACSDQLSHEANKKNIQVIRTYGQTESAGAILFQLDGDEGATSFSDVSVTLNSETQTLQYETKRLAFGKVDEFGYQALPSPFVTQDLALFRGNQILITGRKDQIIICGGENISLRQIEIKLEKIFHCQARVLGVKDERLGQVPIAFLSLPFDEITKLYHQKKDEKVLHGFLESLQRPRYLMTFPREIKGIKPSLEELKTHWKKSDARLSLGKSK